MSSLGAINLGYQMGISTSIFILYDPHHAKLEAMTILVRNNLDYLVGIYNFNILGSFFGCFSKWNLTREIREANNLNVF